MLIRKTESNMQRGPFIISLLIMLMIRIKSVQFLLNICIAKTYGLIKTLITPEKPSAKLFKKMTGIVTSPRHQRLCNTSS